jgi:hypothetical protein
MAAKARKNAKIKITPARGSEILADLKVTPAEVRRARRLVAEAERRIMERPARRKVS